jgi:hypothetical protein
VLNLGKSALEDYVKDFFKDLHLSGVALSNGETVYHTLTLQIQGSHPDLRDSSHHSATAIYLSIHSICLSIYCDCLLIYYELLYIYRKCLNSSYRFSSQTQHLLTHLLCLLKSSLYLLKHSLYFSTQEQHLLKQLPYLPNPSQINQKSNFDDSFPIRACANEYFCSMIFKLVNQTASKTWA